jgi:hypothetical protein
MRNETYRPALHPTISATFIMNPLLRFALTGLCTLFVSGNLFAAGDLPLLGRPGKVLFEDNFARTEMTPRWKIGMGFFTVQDGVVTAAENPADHHGAYAYADPHFPYKDAVAEFSFKFNGGKSCSLRLDDTDYQGSHAGHIIRAVITPTTVDLDDSKFGSMKTDLYEKMRDPNSTAEEKKQVQALMRARMVSFKVEFDVTQWHQARVVVVGDEMLASIDGRPVAYLRSEGVDHPTKNAVGFTIAGDSVQLRNVKVWDATPSPGWAAHRAEVLDTLQKIP